MLTVLPWKFWALGQVEPEDQKGGVGVTSTTPATALTTSCFDVASSATDCAGAANKITYAYDKVSNRTQEVRSGSVGNTGTIDSAYNAADQLTSTTKSENTTNYTYDLNGNAASAGASTFSYDLADRLASTTAAGTTTSYAYDGDDRRVSSAVGGGGADIRFVWDPLGDSGIPELALERDPSGNLLRRYLGGPLGAVSMTNASASFYYHLDPLGTVTDVTDATGAAQWRYAYEAYGAERSATNVSGTAPENRLRFNGQYLDPETALYHLRARQYDSGTGRFGALDPIEYALETPLGSAYGYVDGRPTVLDDPLGLCGLDSFGSFGDCLAEGGKALGNTAAGAANTLTFGTSTWTLNQAGIHPDTGSIFYRGGQVAGYLLPSRAGLRVATTLATRGLRLTRADLLRAGMTGAANVLVGAGYSYFACIPYSWETAAANFGMGTLFGFGGAKSSLAANDRYINLANKARTRHILHGDGKGGGHLWPGLPGKTPFPKNWSAARVMHEISDVATNPTSTPKVQGGWTVITGTRGDVEIRVIIKNNTGEIWTAYPTNLPRNP
jgi:RHS repeat-associated protein